MEKRPGLRERAGRERLQFSLLARPAATRNNHTHAPLSMQAQQADRLATLRRQLAPAGGGDGAFLCVSRRGRQNASRWHRSPPLYCRPACGGGGGVWAPARSAQAESHAHTLTGHPPNKASHKIDPLPTPSPASASASSSHPVAGGGPGTLTLVDSRTGKSYDVPILEGGVIRATDLKQIKAGGDGVGLRTYDPG